MSDWYLCKSLEILRDQINKKWPDRDKSSDGTIGDAAHAARKSEHNPDPEDGAVRALDITNDPAHGLSSEDVANCLRVTRDYRTLYIISNKKIASAEDNWAWRPYTGTNPHTQHFHISVAKPTKNDTGLWNLTQADTLPPVATFQPAPKMPLLKFGVRGLSVKVLERCLGLIEVGTFDLSLEDAVKKFQKEHGLVDDGIVGSYTWGEIMENDNV
jgi:peptidoglycan hydrolase-like protein with peptidoglycan-binding domain